MPDDLPPEGISRAAWIEAKRRFGVEKAEAMRNSHKEQAAVDGFVRGDDGQIFKSNHNNIRRSVDLIEVILSDNGFSNQTHVLCAIMDDWKECKELTDKDANRLRFLIHEKFGFLPPRQLFEDVIMDIAYQNRFHPVRDYLVSLTWDGVPRIDNWLHDYGGAEDTPFNRAVGRIFLIAAVRRVRRPGCKFDTMLVFESPVQGRNKSQAARLLATREDWFNDNLPIGAKPQEVIEQIRGSWIVEFPELAGISSREIEHVKAFLSRQVDKARPAYGRRLESIPRQFVAIGTTNDEEYLKNDERRFWPVRIDKFEIDLLKLAVPQMWAEAAHYEAEDEPITLPEDLWPDAAEVRAARTYENPYETPLRARFGGRMIITSEEAWECLGIARENRQRYGRDVGRALHNMGFIRQRSRGDDDKMGLKRGDYFYEKVGPSSRPM